MHYLDENLLVKILDERAKDRSVNDHANNGTIEAIVEDEVSKVCSAQGIELDKKLRNRCDDLLEGSRISWSGRGTTGARRTTTGT